LTNRAVALEDVFGRDASRLIDSAVRGAVMGRALRDSRSRAGARISQRADSAAGGACAPGIVSVASGGRIEASARSSARSAAAQRHLIAQFRQEIGLTPKTLARVLRFGRAVASSRPAGAELSDIALDCGYLRSGAFLPRLPRLCRRHADRADRQPAARPRRLLGRPVNFVQDARVAAVACAAGGAAMTSNIFPASAIATGHAAIDWLVRTFGFEKQAVFDSPDGAVAHAQLRFGPGVIGLSSAQLRVRTIRGPVRQGIYIHVNDVDAHHDAPGPPVPRSSRR
jgi:AraC-like DNA-binding protein